MIVGGLCISLFQSQLPDSNRRPSRFLRDALPLPLSHFRANCRIRTGNLPDFFGMLYLFLAFEPTAGFEPATFPISSGCSTSSSFWLPSQLPDSNRRPSRFLRDALPFPLSGFRANCRIRTGDLPDFFGMLYLFLFLTFEPTAGFEPATYSLRMSCSTS